MEERRLNPKPRIRSKTNNEVLTGLSKRVKYTGNPAHKKNPGDFGLIPPPSPRRDKTLCDGAQVFKRKLALKLLRKGVLKGLISEQERNEFPQQIWAVSDSGVPLEAQLENEQLGTYHGYPLQPLHPLSKEIVSRWNAGNPTQ